MAVPVQTAEALLQCIYTCNFGYQRVEVDVSSHLDTLSGDDKDGLIRIALAVEIDAWSPFSPKLVAVVWTGTSRKENRFAIRVLFQLLVNQPGSRDPICDHSNHLGAMPITHCAGFADEALD